MLISLSKPGVFYDPETKLRLEYGEVKDVLRIGSLTRQVLNGGGIVIVSPPVTPEPIVKPDPPVAVTMETSTLDLIVDIEDPIPEEKPKPTVVAKKQSGKRGRTKKVVK